MSKIINNWVQIERIKKNELRVSTDNSKYLDESRVQTEQGAMIEVGAIIGAGLLAMRDDDVLEVKLALHREGGE